MNVSRRGFLLSMLAAATAPAIVRAASLMPIKRIGGVIAIESIIDDAIVYSGLREGGNTLLTISQITHEALRILEQNLTFQHSLNLDWDRVFTIPRS